ncbi:MAG TPA: winged helix-turn-helix domain-containing protein, partial [Dokdonella sp.]
MAARILRFGEFRLNPAARELRGDSGPLVLSVSAFDCLAYLVEQRERAVGRDELIAAIWGRADVGDGLLSQAIVQIRHQLGDDRRGQRFVRTVPRFGYRWVAETVEETDAWPPPVALPAAAAEPAPRPVGAVRGSASRRLHGAMPALAIALLLASAAALIADRSRPGAPASDASALAAVLPADVPADTESEWLRFGLMDAVASRLRAAGRSVVATESIVALSRSAAGADARTVLDATGARELIVPSATHADLLWTVRLELRGAAGTRVVQGIALDAMHAARQAADRLLAELGRRAPDDDASQWADDEVGARLRIAHLSGEPDDVLRLLRAAPARLRDTPTLRWLSAAADLDRSRIETGVAELTQLLAELPAEREPVLRAKVLIALGRAAIDRYDYANAERIYSEAIALLEAHEAPEYVGVAYNGRAAARAARGLYADALADFAQASLALDRVGNGVDLARVHANEGMLEALRNRPADALPLLRQSAQRLQQFGAFAGAAETYAAEIDARLALLDTAEAAAVMDRARPLLERLQRAGPKHDLMLTEAALRIATGRPSEAAALLDDVIRDANAATEPIIVAQARAKQARLALAAGDFDSAIRLAAASVPALADADVARARAEAWLTWVRALLAAGREHEAGDEAERLAAWSSSSLQPAASLYARLAQAELHAAAWDVDPAIARYDAALQLAQHEGVPADVAAVADSYGRWLLS